MKILVYINGTEKELHFENTSTVSLIKSEVSLGMRVNLNDYVLYYGEKEIENDKMTLIELINSANSPCNKFIFIEKSNIRNSSLENTNKARVTKIKKSTTKLKIRNYPSRTEILSLLEKVFLSYQISPDEYSLEQHSDCVTVSFNSMDSSKSIYNYLNDLKNSNSLYFNLKVLLFFGPDVEQEYKANRQNKFRDSNESEVDKNAKYKANSLSSTRTYTKKSFPSAVHMNIRKEILKEESNSSQSNTKPRKFNIIKHKEKDTLRYDFKNLSKSMKKNLIRTLDFSSANTQDLSPVKRKLYMLSKQQSLLDKITPDLNRISAPYLSDNEKELIEESNKKEKWIINRNFFPVGNATNHKSHYIPNYVIATPSEPPSNYRFRDVKKDKWLGKRNFMAI